MRILLTILLALVLAGCGAGTPAATEPSDQNVAPAATPAPTEIVLPAETPAPAQTAAPGGSAPEPGSLEQQVAALLAQAVGVDEASLRLASKEAREWPDSALGCPEEGMMYMEVITPGYQLTFTDGMTTYAVHTGENADRALLCENGKPRQLQPAGGSDEL